MTGTFFLRLGVDNKLAHQLQGHVESLHSFLLASFGVVFVTNTSLNPEMSRRASTYHLMLFKSSTSALRTNDVYLYNDKLLRLHVVALFQISLDET